MTPPRISILIVTGAILALVPATGVAAAKPVPPDDSGIGQYEEVVPGGGGNRSAGGKPPKQPATDPVTLVELREFGRDGFDAAALARFTPAVPGPAGRKARRRGDDGAPAPSATGGSDSPLSALTEVLFASGGSGSTGPLLPLLLGFVTALTLAAGVRRRQAS